MPAIRYTFGMIKGILMGALLFFGLAGVLVWFVDGKVLMLSPLLLFFALLMPTLKR
jgi:hypothetical protein